MEYRYKAGDRVRVVGGESVGDRSKWVGREVTLKSHDSGGGNNWDVPAWSMEEEDCHYRFRESELVPVGPVFTVGAKVRRIASPHSFVPIGYETEIKAIDGNTLLYRDADGDLMNSPVEYWELAGPVVTETVTKTRIVPGVYGRVQVVTYANSDRMDLALLPGRTFTPDELDAAAAVLSALAKGLRDVG